MTRPVTGISLNTTAADPNRSLFVRNRTQTPGGSESPEVEFSSLFAEEARSVRSRSTTSRVSVPAEDDPIGGGIDLFPRSQRNRESGGIPQVAATPRGTANVDPPEFVRSQSAEAPHLPRFESVPQAAKFPEGPY
ncbi:MAG: hypothetical protein L0387_25865, partial [Acidobacteria bacterium]|nr:hypothetical protein [Acidobacteriota bacterium]